MSPLQQSICATFWNACAVITKFTRHPYFPRNENQHAWCVNKFPFLNYSNKLGPSKVFHCLADLKCWQKIRNVRKGKCLFARIFFFFSFLSLFKWISLNNSYANMKSKEIIIYIWFSCIQYGLRPNVFSDENKVLRYFSLIRILIGQRQG